MQNKHLAQLVTSAGMIWYLCLKQWISLCFVVSTAPLVTLDLWRRIEQQSDPNSRQVTLMWIPVRLPPNVLLGLKTSVTPQNKVFLSSTTTCALSLLLARPLRWTSRTTRCSGPKEAKAGRRGRTADKPRQTSLWTQADTTSPSRRWSSRASPSLLTWSSQRALMEVICSTNTFDQSWRVNLLSASKSKKSQSRYFRVQRLNVECFVYCFQTVDKTLTGNPIKKTWWWSGSWAVVQVSLCPGRSRRLWPAAMSWSGASWKLLRRVQCSGWRFQRETTHFPYQLVGFGWMFFRLLSLRCPWIGFHCDTWFTFQDVSTLVADTPLISTDVWTMGTDCWRNRVDTQRSPVSCTKIIIKEWIKWKISVFLKVELEL